MSIKVIPKLPFWAVKKAYRTVTLYHFYKRYVDLDYHKKSKVPIPPEEERDLEADWVIAVSFNKGKITGFVQNVATEGKHRKGSGARPHWDNDSQAVITAPLDLYVMHTYRPHTISGKKWDLYWGEDFEPSKDLHQTMIDNNAIYWHIIDTIFTPKRWLVIKRP